MSFPNLQAYPYFAFDTEATGLRYPVDRAFGFGLAVPTGDSWYWDVRHEPNATEWFNDQLRSYRGKVICHNAAYDYLMAIGAGIIIPLELLDDTVIRASLIDEHFGFYDLDSLAYEWCGFGKEDPWLELADLFGGKATKNAQAPNLQRAPAKLVAKYCKGDCKATLRLWEAQEEEIERQSDTDVPLRSIVDFERRILPLAIRTQQRGVRVDPDAAEKAMRGLTPIIFEEQDKLNAIAGWEFNVNSSPQVRKLFKCEHVPQKGWVASDGTPVPSTDKGAPSFGANVLRGMSHPAAAHILEIRSLLKTRDTFLGGHVLGHMVDGRVYPNINQSKTEAGSGVGPGRFSYTEPALQQIPSRNKRVAALIKPCFLPEEGHIWCETDLDTFEVRVFAHLARVPRMLQAYADNPNLDGHQFVADLTGLPRSPRWGGDANAKQLNLSMIFNQGPGSTAEVMGMPWSWDEFEPRDRPGTTIKYKKPGPEAREVIDRYHAFMPGVKELADGCKMRALQRGFVRTAFGRRIRFPHGWKAYKASGLLIQATSADYNKENWILIDEALESDGHLILNVHDSYGLSMVDDPDVWMKAFHRVRDAIQQEGRLNVPLRLGLDGCGYNWWEAINDKLGANEADSKRRTQPGNKGVSRGKRVHKSRSVRGAGSAKRETAAAP